MTVSLLSLRNNYYCSNLSVKVLMQPLQSVTLPNFLLGTHGQRSKGPSRSSLDDLMPRTFRIVKYKRPDPNQPVKCNFFTQHQFAASQMQPQTQHPEDSAKHKICYLSRIQSHQWKYSFQFLCYELLVLPCQLEMRPINSLGWNYQVFSIPAF